MRGFDRATPWCRPRAGARSRVRRLREQAGVGTDAAAAWLRANRLTGEVPAVPDEALLPVLGPLWAAAVATARDEQAEASAAERATLVAAETAALDELAAAVARADAADAEVALLRGVVDGPRSPIGGRSIRA